MFVRRNNDDGEMGCMDNSLFEDLPPNEEQSGNRTAREQKAGRAKPRLRCPQRDQAEFRTVCLDELVTDDHTVRLVWEYVCSVDLSELLQRIRAVEGNAGRNANDPRLLLGVWLMATIDGIGSARELNRLCKEHIAYQWLCGGVGLNYHSLSDFRSNHVEVLDRLLTDSVATLLHEGLINLKQVAQDGMRVRASAGASSFRRRPTLEEHQQEAAAQVDALRNQTDEDNQAATRRQQAARERAARERQERLAKALAEHEQLAAKRKQQQEEKGAKAKPDSVRVSTTDPEAGKMKMGDGGTRPAYNVQLATTTEGGILVGASVSGSGSDNGQLQPMLEQIDERYGRRPEEALVDGGYTTHGDIEQAHADGVAVYGPIKNEKKQLEAGGNPYAAKRRDGEGVAAWRERMGTPEAKQTYRLRASTAEWSNAHFRNRNLSQFRVRGRVKVLAVVLWYALTHNLLRTWAMKN